MRKIIFITLLVLAVLFTGLHFFQIQKEKPKFKTEKVERRTISTQVEASGVIKPVTTVNIGAQVSDDQFKEITGQTKEDFLSEMETQAKADLAHYNETLNALTAT